jgi:hypothetical protein
MHYKEGRNWCDSNPTPRLTQRSYSRFAYTEMIMGAERSTLVSFCYEMVVDFDYFGGVQTLQSDRQQLLRRRVGR